MPAKHGFPSKSGCLPAKRLIRPLDMTATHVTLRHRFFADAPVEHLEEPLGQRGLPPGRITILYILLSEDTGTPTSW